MFRLFHPVITLLSVLALALQGGCIKPPYQLPPPPSEVDRASFGTIGVVSARFDPKVEFVLPAKGSLAGAGRGSATWAAAGFMGPIEGSGGCSGYCGLAVLSMAIVGGTLGGLLGSVTGAARAESAENVEASEATLKASLGGLKVQELLRDRIVRVAQKRTHRSFVVIPDSGPKDPAEKVRYARHTGDGIQSVLETNVPVFALAGPWEVNPPLRFVMDARVKLVRTAADEVLYEAWYRYVGTERKFVDWAADNALTFCAELDLAYAALADKIVDELFLLLPVPLEVGPSLIWPPRDKR